MERMRNDKFNNPEYNKEKEREIKSLRIRVIIDLVCMIIVPSVCVRLWMKINSEEKSLSLVFLWISIMMLFFVDNIWSLRQLEYRDKLDKIAKSYWNSTNEYRKKEERRLRMEYWKEPRDEEYKQHEAESRNLAWKMLWF